MGQWSRYNISVTFSDYEKCESIKLLYNNAMVVNKKNHHTSSNTVKKIIPVNVLTDTPFAVTKRKPAESLACMACQDFELLSSVILVHHSTNRAKHDRFKFPNPQKTLNNSNPP